MVNATVIGISRNLSNKIYMYKVQDLQGNVRDFTQEQLKSALKSNTIHLDNYKLTSDNRLIKSSKSQNITSFSKIYLMMNKDKAVAKFDLAVGLLEVYGKLPYGFTDIQSWIDLRSKFSCAHDVKKFFKSIGIENTEDFIEVTHCVSLQDTFWVKQENSKIKWDSISPFKNNYSNVISTYALEGINIGNKDKNYFSPVVSTNGSFPHTWKLRNGAVYFLKAGSKYTLGGSNSGREPFSEYYASKVAEYLNFNCVKYTIRNHVRHDGRTDTITECKCFTTEEIGSVTADKLGLDSYEKVIDYCKNLSENAYNTIIDMLFLDCLLLNTDRHFANIEFLINNNTLEVLDLTPIFDNNYSLLPRFMEGYDTFNREEYLVRDNRTFKDLYKLVKSHKNYRSKLISLKQFKFKQPENKEVVISERRLAFLNEFLQLQVDYLLKS